MCIVKNVGLRPMCDTCMCMSLTYFIYWWTYRKSIAFEGAPYAMIVGPDEPVQIERG